MKQIAASIMTLAAAILLVGGAHVTSGDTQLFVMALGCFVGLVGLHGWYQAMRERC